MKINEVEALVGITKKNIRFYEEQGLLSPRRNAENSYREYGDEEVQTLRRIKLLRKLGVPIEEIRQMFSGTHTVADGMRRHLISLERERRNLDQSMTLCQELQSMDIPVNAMDTEMILSRMEEMEKGGTSFQNKQEQDIRVRYIAPVIITVIMVVLMIGMSALILWAYKASPEDAPPVWFLWLTVGIFAAIGGGVVLALMQRIREIGKGKLTMQNDTRNRKKKAPIICAAVMIAFLGIFLATILFPLIGEVMGEALAVGFLLIYGGVIVAAIIGIIAALRQRLSEIEGGEEEDARKY